MNREKTRYLVMSRTERLTVQEAERILDQVGNWTSSGAAKLRRAIDRAKARPKAAKPAHFA